MIDELQPPVVTVVQSSADVALDRLRRWLPGTRLRLVRADQGEAVPVGAAAVGDGLVVLGGPMSAYDDARAPWLPETRALLSECVDARIPTLGICLGAQLLAVARGGRVQVGAPPGLEHGVVDVRWRPEATGDPLLGGLAGYVEGRRSTRMLSWHADAVVELPAGAVWLAASAMYPYQAFRTGTAWGLQFHPEAGAETLGVWAAEDGMAPGPVLEDFAAHEAEVTAAGEALGAGFAVLVREHADRRTAAA
ncbi:type 1 glutamine amidotransferase [Cellulomonas chengniuliangii]|uniref:Type 1 glutamine amidotransferase n=1 Tax=Cellulomonas chengniuliangii TaxID=2968084 RepID=A0ABY5KZG9_9CELL|nr:type 1 glutamine amidotransferase [Cellulomonas chengniuliangii]MCC2307292.1 type 1 glutamine amidotransferase [Cellulomonas chengniuliangii]UUI75917.1 type 1 glutamine amidotransferase [Cellulomonas chengniuliangii]